MDKKKRTIIIVLIAAIILVSLVASYFSFVYMKRCQDRSCFDGAFAKCSRVSFLSEEENAVWFYKVLGKEGGNCRVEVELLELKSGGVDVSFLQGKKMVCSPPIGNIAAPQTNLERCTGELKEGMQDYIIRKLHNYILENLGTINEELNKVV